MCAQFTRIRRTLTVGSAVTIILLAVVGLGPTLAGGQAAPNAYYGSVETENGDPISAGTIIVAVADDEVQDTITVDPAGQYGGSGGFADKLRVSSEYDLVTFHLNNKTGVQALETDNPEAETEQFNLTFPTDSTTETTPTDTPTETATETTTATETVTQTPTQTATQTATDTTTATETPTQTKTETSTATQTATATSAETDISAITTQTVTATGTTDQGVDESGTETEAATTTPTSTAPSSQQVVVVNATLDQASVAPGETVTVTAVVNNTGQTNRTFRAGLLTDDSVINTTSTDIPAGATRTVEFEYQPEAAGEYSIAVNGTDAGIVTVSEDDSLLNGLPRLILLFVVLPVVAIYAILKGLAIYLGY